MMKISEAEGSTLTVVWVFELEDVVGSGTGERRFHVWLMIMRCFSLSSG